MPGENAPSLPVRECGLKLPDNTTKRPLLHVTPCAGVWIEIETVSAEIKRDEVTPCAGVWIEI